jgi:hypothetical protein
MDSTLSSNEFVIEKTNEFLHKCSVTEAKYLECVIYSFS